LVKLEKLFEFIDYQSEGVLSTYAQEE